MISSSRITRLCLLLASAPLLVGCSTLGIAQVEDLETLDANVQRQNTATTQRLSNIEGSLQQLVDQEAQRQALLDSMSADVAQMRSWLNSLNIETLSQDAQRASMLAETAETRGRTLLQHYRDRLIQEQQLLMQEIQFIEELMQGASAGASAAADTAAAQPASGSQN
ncbi:MAG: hypothetical protein JSW67_11105 [Candidatus Latescibacterota bacterium]|nr:MAG: hypothetical protein JSW67_11105 [Candidatus Latescibacterota bacterium]